jgi:hypothetical protein
MSELAIVGTLAGIGEQRKKLPQNEACQECGNDEENLASQYPEDAQADLFVCTGCRAVAGI